jgi:peptidyl-prolyl cis-trans isomerase SurA
LGFADVMLPRTRFIAGIATAFALALCLPSLAAPPAEPQPEALVSPAPASVAPASTAPASTAPAGTAPAGAAAAPAATAPAAAKPADTKPHDENGIVALVNDLPITSYELRQRVALVMSTSRIPPEMEKKIRDQVLEQLETELLQRQEAAKNDITVSAVEVDKYIQGLLDENHMTLDQLKDVLKNGHVVMSTFRSQIASQILWQKAVQEKYAGRVTISPETVDAELARIKEGANKVHFLVSEIFLPVDNPDLDDKVRKDAENLEAQLRAGGSFPALARQFSQSPTAAEGGEIGAVYDGQLAPELTAALLTMKTGDISPPIRSTGGYYILLLRQRFEPSNAQIVETKPTEATLPASLPLGRLLLPLGPKPPKDLVDKVMEIAKQIRNAVTSCEIAAKIPASVKGAQYFSLGTTRLADLNQETRAALAKTESGGTAAPFLSAAGIEIFVRCDKAVAKLQKWPEPTREQIEQQLFQEQISALARRYNRDLRRNADIEVR